jgi:hypothetical protein
MHCTVPEDSSHDEWPSGASYGLRSQPRTRGQRRQVTEAAQTMRCPPMVRRWVSDPVPASLRLWARLHSRGLFPRSALDL